jgi:GLPGLI family protein
MFVFLTSYSQVSKGKVVYNIILSPDESILKNDKIGNTYAEMSKKASSFSYVLCFNDSKTSFQKENKLIVKESDQDKMISDLASVMFTTQYNYYFDFMNNYALTESEGTLIKETVKPINWLIKSDSKVIDGIKCFQALSEIEYIGRDNQIKFKKIIAWFVPSLPYSFGPKNFHGLPGLILELTENRTTYLASTVDLKDDTINVAFPRGKTISQEEYTKKVLSN